MKKIFTFFAVAAMAFAAQANVLTVCDGTARSEDAPYDSWLHETDLSPCSQMIYPASMLTDMVGATITQVKFYTTKINFSGGELSLEMGATTEIGFVDEVHQSIPGGYFASYIPEYGATELVVNLVDPFVYEGGNLILHLYQEWQGISYGETSYYGVYMDYNCALHSYYDSEDYVMHYEAIKFLPKVSFTYEPGTTPPTPTERTGAPVFNGYTIDGIHAYFIEIVETEPSTIYYKVYMWDDELGDWAIYGEDEWTEYEWILSFTDEGKYRVVAYAVAPGKADSYDIAYEFVVSPITGLSELANGKTISNVRYFNMAGQEMSEANGLTIVVTTYTDGTTSTAKVVK